MAFYKVQNTCGCDKCTGAPPGTGTTITKAIAAKSALRFKESLAMELHAHGVPGLKFKANGKVDMAVPELHVLVHVHLVDKGAYLLTSPVEVVKPPKKKKVRLSCALILAFVT